MMVKRKAIGKKVRFDVFKRDSFTCQYCGKSAPDVILHIDHIIPIKDGGTNAITNLITACSGCNLGKGAVRLDDNTTIQKEKKQLDEINKRREQMEMMVKWKDELENISSKEADLIAQKFERLSGMTLNKPGKRNIEKWLIKFPFGDIYDAIPASISRNGAANQDGEYTLDSMIESFNYIPNICVGMKLQRENPAIKDLYYIRGILRNRFSYCDERKAIYVLKKANALGIGTSELKSIALDERNWSNWISSMEEIIARHQL